MTKSLRWNIALLITAAIAISYFDRQTLPIAIQAIQRELPVTNAQFSHLQAAFLAAYALMYAGSGKLIDLLGTRLGFLLIMVWWSLACASQGLATSVPVLAVSLFLLGMGEGGGFPAATKAMAEWFPANERSSAMGLMNAGTAVGAVAAPPLIALTLVHLSWRWVFFLAGAVGLVWTIWWIRDYQPAASHPRLSPGERVELAEVLAPKSKSNEKVRWIDLFRYPQVSGLVFAKFLSDAAWYFYIFWLPKYLYDVHHFNTKEVGYFAWIPYAAAGVGSLLGGWFSSELIRRGHSLNMSRKIALGVSAGVMPSILLVMHAPVDFVIVLFSIAFAGQQSWSTLVMTLPSDIVPASVVGSLAGLVGFGGAMGGIVFGLAVGQLLDHGFGYGPVFAVVGVLHLIAFCVILFTNREIGPIDFPTGTPRVAVA
ncbi:MAG TPA: MFS transporter [Acidobacteriaceae bacterium]|nr:MFS transporter [Acidobacteriaceae bacterium]